MLIAAYACNPFHGSEPGVGWEWISAISRQNRAVVITAEFNRMDIERKYCGGDNPRFVYVPDRPWHYSPTSGWKRIEGSLLKPIMNVAYVSWQKSALRVARELMRSEAYDLIHQVTYVGYRFPGRLWTLGVPFVWGPIGGMENTAWPLLPAMGPRGAVEYAARNVVNSAQKRWLGSARRAARAAGPGLIAATSGVAREMKRHWGVDATVLCEVTPPGDFLTMPPRRCGDQPFRIAWAGRHLPGKALHLLLRALARLPSSLRWELDVYGAGPMRAAWQRKAQELGIGRSCHWLGKVPRDKVIEGLSETHLFALSSLKDLTSTVLLEALSLGLPVLCPDHCGFADVVTEQCGVKVPVKDVETLVAGFAKAIEGLAGDEQRRYRMGQAALERAKEYTWETKRTKLNEVYERVLMTARSSA